VGTLVRDAAVILSFAAQHGADVEAIRRALSRDSHGQPLGPLGVALDLLHQQQRNVAAKYLDPPGPETQGRRAVIEKGEAKARDLGSIAGDNDKDDWGR